MYSVEELMTLNKLYIKEQNIEITLNPLFSFFNQVNNLYVIIGYEIDHTYKNKNGELVCGIVEIEKNGNEPKVKLILPFSSKILYAKISPQQDQVMVYYKENKLIKKTILSINNNFIDYQEMSFLKDEARPLIEDEIAVLRKVAN